MRKVMNEQPPISESSPLKARFYDYPYFTYPQRPHTECEIIYVREDTGMCFVGNNAEKYADGDILLLGPDLPHYMKSDEVYRQESSTFRTAGAIIQFGKDLMHHTFDYCPHFMKVKNLLEEAQRGIYSLVGYSPRLADLLGSIPVGIGVDQITSFLQLLKEMTNVVSRSVLSASDFENDIIYGGSRIDKIIAHLNKNYTRQTDLNEISSLVAMNPTAFCRFLKSETGKSLKNYILEMWIEYARKLSLVGDMNISQISVGYGSDTISRFSKSFEKHIGFTPSYYKRMMLAKQK